MWEKAQSFNEYAIVIALITLVVMGTQIYIKRGIQGIVKTSADTLAGEQTEGRIEVDEATRAWHPLAIAYRDKLIAGEFFVRERAGNSFYYNVYIEDPDNPTKIKKDRGIGIEDIATGNFTSLDIDGNPLPVVYDKDGKALTGVQGAAYVQQGVVESGLVKFEYKDPKNPLVFKSDKKITVDTLSKYSGPKSLAPADWHPAMTAYKERMEKDKIKGFIQTEIRGSRVYYYQFTTDPKDRILVGGEATRTGDFTGFDPDGFPVSTVDSKLTVLRTYSGYVTDPETEEIIGVTGSDGKVYGQHEIVKISPVSPSVGPATVASPMRTKTIDKDETTVTGAWKATYKLEGAGTFGALEKQKGKATNPGGTP
ncbi:MAG: hypothetical protein V1670_03175 [Candidatus Omnitrophota bacterium]